MHLVKGTKSTLTREKSTQYLKGKEGFQTVVEIYHQGGVWPTGSKNSQSLD